VKLPYLADNQLTALCKRLQGQGYGALKDLLREQGKTPFDEGSVIPTLDSSYKENGYQYLFYALTRLLQPESIVEIGVLQGFSLLSIGCALKANGRGEIHAFDLFEEYEYKCDNFDNVSSRVSTMGLDKCVTLHQADAPSVTGLIEETDILHVDVSNDGEIVGEIFSQWASRTSRVMIFEGGSLERDRVEWMVKYNKKSIFDEFLVLSNNEPEWHFFTIHPFPSVTIAVNGKYEP
jgi:hypothetical protein